MGGADISYRPSWCHTYIASSSVQQVPAKASILCFVEGISTFTGSYLRIYLGFETWCQCPFWGDWLAIFILLVLNPLTHLGNKSRQCSCDIPFDITLLNVKTALSPSFKGTLKYENKVACIGRLQCREYKYTSCSKQQFNSAEKARAGKRVSQPSTVLCTVTYDVTNRGRELAEESHSGPVRASWREKDRC